MPQHPVGTTPLLRGRGRGFWRQLLENAREQMEGLQAPISLGQDEGGNEIIFTERMKQEMISNINAILSGQTPPHLTEEAHEEIQALLQNLDIELPVKGRPPG